MQNINTVSVGDYVTDGEGNFAIVKEDERGQKYYANYFPDDELEILHHEDDGIEVEYYYSHNGNGKPTDVFIPVDDFDEDHLNA